MFKLNSRLMTGAALTALLLAGCGGGGGDDVQAGGGGGGGGNPPPMEQTVTNVFDFISNLMANNSENSDPIDINGLTLAADDSSEPTPFN